MNRKSTPAHERVLARIVVSEDGCWTWQGVPGAKGYGNIRLGGKGTPTAYIHRVVYEALVGPIPVGAQLDHTCHTRALTLGTCTGGTACVHRRCVNPAHLEPVTRKENLRRGNTVSGINARKTHCPEGHPYAGPNLMQRSNGRRVCRICKATQRTRGATHQGGESR